MDATSTDPDRGGGRATRLWRPLTAVFVLLALTIPASAGEVLAAGGGIQAIHPIRTSALHLNQDGKGILMTNAPYGYYTGRLFPSDEVFELFVTHSRIYTYDAVVQHRAGMSVLTCGWIEATVLRTGRAEAAPESVCASDPRRTFTQSSFGKSFNCPPKACVDGAPTRLTARCDDRAYYNYAGQADTRDASLASFKGLYDYAGALASRSRVFYRYTSRDGRVAIVRTRKYGWNFLPVSCIAGHPKGGAPKLPSLELQAQKLGTNVAVSFRSIATLMQSASLATERLLRGVLAAAEARGRLSV